MRLILHSDDFGLHPAINRAILTAAAKGALTSTSLMINGPAAGEAMEQVKAFPWLGVGLHLNIVRGRPLSDPAEIPTLVNRKGFFFNSAGKLLQRSFMRQLSSAEIYLEYGRQLQRMLDWGMVPTHFDGEKHTHLLMPEAVKALQRIMDEYQIRKVRWINESPVNGMLAAAGIRQRGSLSQRLKLSLLEYRSKRACRQWSGCKGPDFFWGVLLSGHIHDPGSVAMVIRLLQAAPNGTLEWMMHLGYPARLNVQMENEGFGRFFLDQQREEELKLLLSDEVLGEIERNRNDFISYREL